MTFRIALILSLAAALASCGPKYQPQTAIVDPGPPQRVPPTIRVLDPGVTPRAPLRYRVAPGHTEVLYIELVMLRSVESHGQGAQGGIPPIQLEVKMGPAEMTPEGFVRHPVQITQIRLSKVADRMQPVAREQLEESLEPLLQVRGWSEMDVQGRIRRSQFEGLGNVEPRIASILSNIRAALLTVPFPAEPVGVRARWEVDRRIQVSGAWIDQAVRYDLMSRTEGTLKLQISATQTADQQPMGNAKLEAYQASILGSAVVRLGNFTPFSEADSTSQMRIQTMVQGQQETVRIETKTAVRLYPAEAAGEFEAAGEEPAEPEPAEDPRKITDPGKQELRWLK
ncbi:MAG: hypothetical protein AAF436_06090 [Myxococcota bacterium]